jgi:predicted PurR-regulated permease PerM
LVIIDLSIESGKLEIAKDTIMNQPAKMNQEKSYIEMAIDIAIRVGVLALLLTWCFQILRPFITLVIWGAIIAISFYPVCRKLSALLGNRIKVAASIMIIIALLLIILPSIQIVASLVDGVTYINDKIQIGEIKVPPPPENIDAWPVIGKLLKKSWHEASVNLMATLARYSPQLKAISLRLVELAMSTTMGLLQFTLSIVIAGVLMANAKGGGNLARELFVSLAGERGRDFADISTITIRNVVKGILGVAIIQGLLAGMGFMIAGVPGAGIWAFLCLFLAIIQIGIAPVVIPVIIYMFYTANTLTAGLLMVWLILVMLSDNFLKPILLGRGAPAPMLVIFLGSIGGFISMGFIGLFVGAVILSLGFKLFQAWLKINSNDTNNAGMSEAFPSENSEAGGH